MSDVSTTLMQNEIMDGFAVFWADRSQIASPNDRAFNRQKVPADDDAYIQWALGGGTESRHSHSVARNNFSRTGPIVFTAHVRLRQGLDAGYALLDAASHFMEAYKLDTVYFTELGTPADEGGDGAWHQITLGARWNYFTDRTSVVT